MPSQSNAGRNTTWLRSTKRVATALGLSAVMAVAGLTSCSDASTGPTAPPSTPAASASLLKLTGGILGQTLKTAGKLTTTVVNTTSSLTGTLVHGLLWSSPASGASASSVIGPAGGTFSIPNGIRVIVPPGAVSSNVTFSVTRVPGLIVAYEFEPHGTTFAVPVQIEQPTSGTQLLGVLGINSSTTVRGAYFANQSLLDQLLGLATVSEFRPATISSNGQWIRFSVDHFSGYMVSMD